MTHLDSHFNSNCVKLQSSGRTEPLGNLVILGFVVAVFLWVSLFVFPVYELLHMDSCLLKTPKENIRKLLHRYTKVCFGVNLIYRINKFFPCLPSFSSIQSCVAYSKSQLHCLYVTHFLLPVLYNLG